MSTWSAPVRYGEADGQGVVFNAHYLLYCDEAMSAFCSSRGVGFLAERVQLVTSTLTWKSPARWGDTVSVDVSCQRVGTTSFTLDFLVRVEDRVCCEVRTVYVFTDESWRPAAVPDEARRALTE